MTNNAVGQRNADMIRSSHAMLAFLDGSDVDSGTAAEIGFADQSHLVREIRDITGLAPGKLLARLQAIRHDGVRA